MSSFHAFDTLIRNKPDCTFFAHQDTHLSVHRLLWEMWHPGSAFRPCFDRALELARSEPGALYARSFHTELHQTEDRFLLVPVDRLESLLREACAHSTAARIALDSHDIKAIIATLQKQWNRQQG